MHPFQLAQILDAQATDWPGAGLARSDHRLMSIKELSPGLSDP